MPFQNDLNVLLNYLERYCKTAQIHQLDDVSDAQVNLLLDFLTLAHKLNCDIYATGSLKSSHFLGIGVFTLEQHVAPQGNLFLKVESGNLYIAFELDSCSQDNLLTPIRVIDALTYLADKNGHGLLPENYRSIKQA